MIETQQLKMAPAEYQRAVTHNLALGRATSKPSPVGVPFN